MATGFTTRNDMLPLLRVMPPRSRSETVLDPVVLLCRAHGLPLPEKEVVFLEGRKFRADNLWRREMVILEIEGGLFSRSPRARMAHAMPLAILRDMQKSNLAQLAGYVYLRATPEQVQNAEILPMLKDVLGVKA